MKYDGNDIGAGDPHLFLAVRITLLVLPDGKQS